MDKSLLIKELLEDGSKVRLLTRPRSFGKTLNMSMIQYFFESTPEDNAYLFENLEIAKYPEYMKEQGKYPVINVSFKDMKQDTFELAYYMYTIIMKLEFERHKDYIYSKNVLSNNDKECYESFLSMQASDADYRLSLLFLTNCMEKAYDQSVILLIDEYDEVIKYGIAFCKKCCYTKLSEY